MQNIFSHFLKQLEDNSWDFYSKSILGLIPQHTLRRFVLFTLISSLSQSTASVCV
jgi:hypothetical protein